MLHTYILKYYNSKAKISFYCGCSPNPRRRIKEHILGMRTKWKKDIINFFIIYGNYEKKIKNFGVRKMYEMLKEGEPVLRTPVYPKDSLESEGESEG